MISDYIKVFGVFGVFGQNPGSGGFWTQNPDSAYFRILTRIRFTLQNQGRFGQKSTGGKAPGWPKITMAIFCEPFFGLQARE